MKAKGVASWNISEEERNALFTETDEPSRINRGKGYFILYKYKLMSRLSHILNVIDQMFYKSKDKVFLINS
jgi:hypothetical protein